MDDSRAIQKLKKGDISGLEFLIARYQVKAFRTAVLILHDEVLAEDVVQETFLRIYERIRYFDENQPMEPYFMRSVANAALNEAKKASRHIPLNEETEPMVLERLLQKALTTESLVEYANLKQEISSALAKLKPRERMVIIERYYLEMSEKEMAAEHSIAPGTIKWLLNTARHKLRKFIHVKGQEK
jgi:RNA polymerase sigma-70 factor (ECF subfamily)